MAVSKVDPQPESAGSRTYDLYEAVERLKDYTVLTYNDLEHDGELGLLIDQLAEIRTRADVIQDAALGVRSALVENL